MIEIVVQNNYSYVSNTTHRIEGQLNKLLKFQPSNYFFSPLYKKRVWDGYVRCYDKKNSRFPTGLLNRVIKFFKSINIPFKIYDERKASGKKITLVRKKKLPPLRDYQEKAIDIFLKKHRGVLNLATGLGKTRIALEIIDKMKLKTMFVCPNTVIMQQVAERFEQVFGKTKVGLYYGKKKQIKRPIVVSCVSSLKSLDKKDFNDIGLLILDEFHHCLFGGTKIKTNLGVKSIQQIVENKLKCKVLSYNIKENKWEYKEVVNFFKYNCPDNLIEIKYQSHGTIKTLICTENHKIYTSNRGYIEAQHLTTEDDVIIEKPFICHICMKKHETISGFGGCVSGHQTPLYVKQNQAKKMLKHKNWNSKNARKLNSLSKMGNKNPSKRKEVRKKKSISQKKWWNSLSVEEQNKRTEIFVNAPKYGIKKGPTNLEKRIINLNIQEVRFTGNGKFWLTSDNKKMNPDFKIKNQRKVIEVGDIEYWHTLEEIEQRILDFKKINFQCLYFTNKDLEKLNDQQLIKNIKEFIYG